MSEPVPPAPPGWNKTMDDLFAEMQRGERSSIGSPEADWARAYARSLIPADMRFPRQGDVYEALGDLTVSYLTSWAAPFTGSGEGVLKQGDRVVINSEPADAQPISTYAIPVDYQAVEIRMVPASDRHSRKYTGVHFSLSTVDLNRKFKLVQEGQHQPGEPARETPSVPAKQSLRTKSQWVALGTILGAFIGLLAGKFALGLIFGFFVSIMIAGAKQKTADESARPSEAKPKP